MQACTFEVTEGLLFLARRQTRGRGRGNNTWVSPDGCLMFTFKSSLRTGSRLPFVQYLVALAVVEAVSRLRGALKLRLKWPNDIYSDSAAKVGGVLCQSSSMKGGAFDICIGVGLNLDNEQPTTCINKLLRGLEGAPVGREELLASFCNVFEPWLEELEVRGFAPFLERYLQAWLHSGQTIEVRATSGSTFRARIDGLSPDGFLKAQRTDTRQVFELHPDGNSLDFLQGLIAAKELPEGKS
jgi:biotin--protein ligase